eukprot:TRINITY_DN4120_c0_g1_i4.p1 TRINITY_DN4120_c0_g1~~TRINITY_DN4120_c0_g1_i4.p1  ORF type:complete len:426 (+),score=119.57 TRINITY_DN4120_c0_g1_i4:58-1278(+)
MGSHLQCSAKMGRLVLVVILLGNCIICKARAKRIVLDETLLPTNVEFPQSRTSQYIKERMTTFERLGSGRKPVGNKTYLFGTDTLISHGRDDRGFLSVVFEAYANHLDLVTSPEDWWLTVVQRVAQAVDKNSGKETVKNHFVSHEDKKQLFVNIYDIYDIKEAKFFSKMSELVQENIKDPEYVTNLQADFTTSTPLHGIVFNIAMMSSLQQFFEFGGRIACGIPELEMKGTRADWEKLLEKSTQLRKRLEPVSVDIGLPGKWWDGTQEVLSKLLDTYDGKPDKGWWKQIIDKREVNVGCGTATEWDGWFLKDFLSLDISQVDSSLVSVPLTIDDNGKKTVAALVAGIAGFKVKNNKTSVEAQHAWNLLLPPNSYLREDKTVNTINNMFGERKNRPHVVYNQILDHN